MTSPTEIEADEALTEDAGAERRSPLIVVLLIILAVAALTTAVALGYLARGGGTRAAPSTTSVDAGFARDNADDPAVKLLAYDIETSQYFQVGQMQGRLDTWGPVRNNPSSMAWIAGHGHVQNDGLMPGMATPAQMTKLETLHGKRLDIYFLQLMTHHQGALPMARYARPHARCPTCAT